MAEPDEAGERMIKWIKKDFNIVTKSLTDKDGRTFQKYEYTPKGFTAKGCIASVVGGYGVKGYRQWFLPEWYFLWALSKKYSLTTIIYNMLQEEGVNRSVQIDQTLQALEEIRPDVVIGDSYGGGILFDICLAGKLPPTQENQPPFCVYHSPTLKWHSKKTAEAKHRFETTDEAQHFLDNHPAFEDWDECALAAVRLGEGIPKSGRLQTVWNVVLAAKGDEVVENPTQINEVLKMSAKVFTFAKAPGHSVNNGVEPETVVEVLDRCYAQPADDFGPSWEIIE